MGNENQIKNSSITRQEDDFAQWYTDVCKKAELMDLLFIDLMVTPSGNKSKNT